MARFPKYILNKRKPEEWRPAKGDEVYVGHHLGNASAAPGAIVVAVLGMGIIVVQWDYRWRRQHRIKEQQVLETDVWPMKLSEQYARPKTKNG